MSEAADIERLIAALPPDQGAAARLAEALRHIVAHFEAVSGTIHVADGQESLRLAASVGVPPSLMPIIATIPIGKGIAGAAALRREPVTICNLQTDESGVAKPGAKITGVEGAIAVPILDGEALVGVLGVGKQQPYTYSIQETELLLRLGQRLISDMRPKRL